MKEKEIIEKKVIETGPFGSTAKAKELIDKEFDAFETSKVGKLEKLFWKAKGLVPEIATSKKSKEAFFNFFAHEKHGRKLIRAASKLLMEIILGGKARNKFRNKMEKILFSVFLNPPIALSKEKALEPEFLNKIKECANAYLINGGSVEEAKVLLSQFEKLRERICAEILKKCVELCILCKSEDEMVEIHTVRDHFLDYITQSWLYLNLALMDEIINQAEEKKKN